MIDLIVMCKTIYEGCLVLTIYMDDILLISCNVASISTTKAYFYKHFMKQGLQKPHHFIRIELTYELGKLVLS